MLAREGRGPAFRSLWAGVVLLAVLLGAMPAFAEADAPSAADALETYDPLFDDEFEEVDEDAHDPFEWGNRHIFAFNDALDCRLWDPITRVYQFVMPSPARRGVNRFFDNLNSPVIFTNEILQLRPKAAGVTLVRFVSNTTIGVAGFFDPGFEWLGLPRGEADFGQTLSRYGVPRGPYIVIPVLGPSTTRDALGTLVDQALHPITYLIGPLNVQWRLLVGGGQGLSVRDSNYEALTGLREASVDYYASLRSAYLQSRKAVERAAPPWWMPVEPMIEAESEALPEAEALDVLDAEPPPTESP